MLKLKYKKLNSIFRTLPTDPKDYLGLCIKVFNTSYLIEYLYEIINVDLETNEFEYRYYEQGSLVNTYSYSIQACIEYFYICMNELGNNKLISIQKIRSC